jgi:hypothetical protein
VIGTGATKGGEFEGLGATNLSKGGQSHVQSWDWQERGIWWRSMVTTVGD